jgi:hypothetical protein
MISSDCSEARMEMDNLSSLYLQSYPTHSSHRQTQKKVSNNGLPFLIDLNELNLLKGQIRSLGDRLNGHTL